MADAPRDQNFVPTVLLESSTNPGVVLAAKGDQVTGRLLVDSASGSGTVTSVSVVTANGISGSVADPTTTPAITLTLGAITPTTVNKVTITAPATASTLTIDNGFTLHATGNVTALSGSHTGTSSGTNTGDQNLFSTIAVSGQSDIVADSTSDTLTLAAGSNITITTNAGTDTVTIAASGGGSGAMTLLHASSGNTTSTTQSDLDSFAISGLTASDTLVMYFSMQAVGNDAGAFSVRNSTDDVQLFAPSRPDSGTQKMSTFQVMQSANTNTAILADAVGVNGSGTTITFTTAWTGSWTLLLRQAGVTAGATVYWNWRVYKIAGE